MSLDWSDEKGREPINERRVSFSLPRSKKYDNKRRVKEKVECEKEEEPSEDIKYSDELDGSSPADARQKKKWKIKVPWKQKKSQKNYYESYSEDFVDKSFELDSSVEDEKNLESNSEKEDNKNGYNSDSEIHRESYSRSQDSSLTKNVRPLSVLGDFKLLDPTHHNPKLQSQPNSLRSSKSSKHFEKRSYSVTEFNTNLKQDEKVSGQLKRGNFKEIEEFPGESKLNSKENKKKGLKLRLNFKAFSSKSNFQSMSDEDISHSNQINEDEFSQDEDLPSKVKESFTIENQLSKSNPNLIDNRKLEDKNFKSSSSTIEDEALTVDYQSGSNNMDLMKKSNSLPSIFFKKNKKKRENNMKSSTMTTKYEISEIDSTCSSPTIKSKKRNSPEKPPRLVKKTYHGEKFSKTGLTSGPSSADLSKHLKTNKTSGPPSADLSKHLKTNKTSRPPSADLSKHSQYGLSSHSDILPRKQQPTKNIYKMSRSTFIATNSQRRKSSSALLSTKKYEQIDGEYHDVVPKTLKTMGDINTSKDFANFRRISHNSSRTKREVKKTEKFSDCDDNNTTKRNLSKNKIIEVISKVETPTNEQNFDYPKSLKLKTNNNRNLERLDIETEIEQKPKENIFPGVDTEESKGDNFTNFIKNYSYSKNNKNIVFSKRKTDEPHTKLPETKSEESTPKVIHKEVEETFDGRKDIFAPEKKIKKSRSKSKGKGNKLHSQMALSPDLSSSEIGTPDLNSETKRTMHNQNSGDIINQINMTEFINSSKTAKIEFNPQIKNGSEKINNEDGRSDLKEPKYTSDSKSKKIYKTRKTHKEETSSSKNSISKAKDRLDPKDVLNSKNSISKAKDQSDPKDVLNSTNSLSKAKDQSDSKDVLNSKNSLNRDHEVYNKDLTPDKSSECNISKPDDFVEFIKNNKHKINIEASNLRIRRRSYEEMTNLIEEMMFDSDLEGSSDTDGDEVDLSFNRKTDKDFENGENREYKLRINLDNDSSTETELIFTPKLVSKNYETKTSEKKESNSPKLLKRPLEAPPLPPSLRSPLEDHDDKFKFKESILYSKFSSLEIDNERMKKKKYRKTPPTRSLSDTTDSDSCIDDFKRPSLYYRKPLPKNPSESDSSKEGVIENKDFNHHNSRKVEKSSFLSVESCLPKTSVDNANNNLITESFNNEQITNKINSDSAASVAKTLYNKREEKKKSPPVIEQKPNRPSKASAPIIYKDAELIPPPPPSHPPPNDDDPFTQSRIQVKESYNFKNFEPKYEYSSNMTDLFKPNNKRQPVSAYNSHYRKEMAELSENNWSDKFLENNEKEADFSNKELITDPLSFEMQDDKKDFQFVQNEFGNTSAGKNNFDLSSNAEKFAEEYISSNTLPKSYDFGNTSAGKNNFDLPSNAEKFSKEYISSNTLPKSYDNYAYSTDGSFNNNNNNNNNFMSTYPTQEERGLNFSKKQQLVTFHLPPATNIFPKEPQFTNTVNDQIQHINKGLIHSSSEITSISSNIHDEQNKRELLTTERNNVLDYVSIQQKQNNIRNLPVTSYNTSSYSKTNEEKNKGILFTQTNHNIHHTTLPQEQSSRIFASSNTASSLNNDVSIMDENKKVRTLPGSLNVCEGTNNLNVPSRYVNDNLRHHSLPKKIDEYRSGDILRSSPLVQRQVFSFKQGILRMAHKENEEIFDPTYRFQQEDKEIIPEIKPLQTNFSDSQYPRMSRESYISVNCPIPYTKETKPLKSILKTNRKDFETKTQDSNQPSLVQTNIKYIPSLSSEVANPIISRTIPSQLIHSPVKVANPILSHTVPNQFIPSPVPTKITYSNKIEKIDISDDESSNSDSVGVPPLPEYPPPFVRETLERRQYQQQQQNKFFGELLQPDHINPAFGEKVNVGQTKDPSHSGLYYTPTIIEVAANESSDYRESVYQNIIHASRV